MNGGGYAILSMGEQARFFLVMCAVGAACGGFYDVISFFRAVTRSGRLASAFGDLVYWAACVTAVFYAVLRGDGGRVRVFAVFGVLLGMAFYRAALSPLFGSALKRIVRGFTKEGGG